MSTLAADVAFDFTFPPACEPTTPPSFSFDNGLLEIPCGISHARSNSQGSAYSFISSAASSSPSDSAMTANTRTTTPARSPIRTHGPILLPKIRMQDQTMTPSVAAVPPAKRARTSPTPPATIPRRNVGARGTFRPSHTRSFTNPGTISYSAALTFGDDEAATAQSSLLCSPVSFAPSHDGAEAAMLDLQPRRASSCNLDSVTLERYGFPTYRQMPSYVATTLGSHHGSVGPTTSNIAGSAAPMRAARHLSLPPPDAFPQYSQQPMAYIPRAPSPLASVAVAPEAIGRASSVTPEPVPTTTLMEYLTAPNPAPSLVRTIDFPLRSPHTRHFWWDVRQVRPWAAFTTSALLSLPGADALLSCPVPEALLPALGMSQRHPETEAALHSTYAAHYLPRLNAALALSSARPLQLTVPAKLTSASSGMATDCVFVANVAGEAASAAAIFGGKPTARVVGLVKSFDRFNTGMRVEGNVKRVEYLRGLSHLHHAMREHGCRYGFILTEIELIIARNGGEATPHFGYLEVASVQLAASASSAPVSDEHADIPMTACLALWGLCMLAGDEPPSGNAHWRAEIGAPAEGTRRKALPRDDWMPQPQLAEKREAKRARGWVLPEDPVGRKELGKRGVRYGAC